MCTEVILYLCFICTIQMWKGIVVRSIIGFIKFVRPTERLAIGNFDETYKTKSYE